jgi:hypothetical protein
MPASKSLNLVTGTLARLASQVHRLTWWLFSFMYSDWEQCCLLPARNIVCGHDHRVQYFLEFYSAKVISRSSPPPPFFGHKSYIISAAYLAYLQYRRGYTLGLYCSYSSCSCPAFPSWATFLGYWRVTHVRAISSLLSSRSGDHCRRVRGIRSTDSVEAVRNLRGSSSRYIQLPIESGASFTVHSNQHPSAGLAVGRDTNQTPQWPVRAHLRYARPSPCLRF